MIERDGRLDFDAMQMRLHPAESRVRRLSAEIPAQYVVFDLLLWDGEPVWRRPLEERRAELAERAPEGFRLSPFTRDLAAAEDWLERIETAGLDGVVAKRLGLPYLPGSREGVAKVKRHKTADCVVAGVRWKAKPTTIATLLLGLYADDGHLDYVGSAAVGARRHAEIAERVLPLLDETQERRFSEPNRWGTNGLEEAPLKPELVVEVRYDKLEKSRFRHGTKLIRFRPDKDPDQCTWREVRPARRPDDPVAEIDALDQLHGEEPAVGVGDQLEERDQVRVCDVGERASDNCRIYVGRVEYLDASTSRRSQQIEHGHRSSCAYPPR